MKALKKYRVDIIVISALVLLSLTLLFISIFTRESGAYVTVEIDGKETARYSLSVNGTYTLNGGTNILTIEDGTASLTYSSCPDHLCEDKGKIRYVGERIICLPNRVTVTVSGEGDGGVDLVS